MRIIFLICLILLFQLTLAAPVCSTDSVTGSFTTGDFESPAKVLDLSATSLTSYSVKLLWTAPGDDGDIGKASAYDIRYSISPITTENKWLNSNRVFTGIPAPQLAGSNQTCTVSGLLPNTTYYFALKTVDDCLNWSALSNCASVVTPVEYSQTPTTPVIQPTQTTTAPGTLEDEGPIYINIKGKRGVIFLGLMPDGTLARTTIITLNNYQLEVTILKGTILLDRDGNPINVIVLEYLEPYLAPPPGYAFQATYNFQPYCVIEPPVEIKMVYTLLGLPADAGESSINIASYNQNQNNWITLSTTRDIVHRLARTEITYFSLFSLLVPESTAGGPGTITPSSDLSIKNLKLSSNIIEPGATLTVSVDVVNAGDVEGELYVPLILDGITLDSKTVVLAALQGGKETFNLVLEEEGIHTISVGPLSAIVNVKKAVVPAAGFFSTIRTPLIWSSIIGLALVCIIILINLWRKGKVSPRRL